MVVVVGGSLEPCGGRGGGTDALYDGEVGTGTLWRERGAVALCAGGGLVKLCMMERWGTGTLRRGGH